MPIVEILYIILSIAVVVLTIALVWLINDLVKTSRSMRRSTDDVAIMTKEVKEKVLMVTEVMDRMGTLASHFIGIIEEAEKQIREKSARIFDGLGMVLGVSDMIKKRKANKVEEADEEEEDEPEEEPEEKPVEKEKLKEKKTAEKEEKEEEKKDAEVEDKKKSEEAEAADDKKVEKK